MDEKRLDEIMEGYWYHNELIRLNILNSTPLMTTKDLSRKIDDSWTGLSKTENELILPPRLPLDPFVLFVSNRIVSDIRLQTTPLSIDKDEVIPEFLCEWKQMTAEERAPFLQMADLDRKNYDKEIESYLNYIRTIQYSMTTITTNNNTFDNPCSQRVMESSSSSCCNIGNRGAFSPIPSPIAEEYQEDLNSLIITDDPVDSPERIFVKQEQDYVYGLTNNSVNNKKEPDYEYGLTKLLNTTPSKFKCDYATW
ncbi:5450_t:CDS:2 [Ambispora gerdemannii]|uniref:5450_t:CDS:1 n=1 Tax=Ambispora gerdemannii TaxID=144530 RepID=A0A9N8ZHV7_9GLOM|nr:5450_t:CDS:2 [Ambispora gerdemannii]